MSKSDLTGYFMWGIFNGLVLSILLKFGVDITKEGIITKVIDGLKPLFSQTGISIFFIKLLIFIGGILSTYIEVKKVVDEGGIALTCAVLGFLGIFLLVLGINFGVWFLIAGAIIINFS